MAGFLTTNTDPTGQLETVRGLLTRLRGVPALAERYAGFERIDDIEELVKVPVMLKDDLNVALEHLQPRAESGGTWIFQSGGSTGSPKLGYAPTGLYMDEVWEHWKALGPDDIYVNGWIAGKLWGANPLMACYADLSGCASIGLGTITPDEYGSWLQFFVDRKVTSYGATTSVLRNVFSYARDAGFRLPDLRSVLWLGEAWDPQLDEDLPVVAPNAKRWGLFGSTETWVVGHNTPDCGPDMWHVLPSQLVHVGDDELLDFTSLKPHGLNPVLRYQTGDAGELVACTCGSGDTVMRVLGRRDGAVKVWGGLVDIDALLAEATAVPGVARAQVLITDYPDRASTLEVLVQVARGADPDLAAFRNHLITTWHGLNARDPELIQVRTRDTLISNERTGKTPNLVRRQGS
jgi:phenylacetate-CoA ligase